MDLTGLGSIADLAKGVLDKFWPPLANPEEKLKFQLELQRMIEARESAIIDAQKSVMVAEMTQGDPYTKRARPTICYAGLGFIFLVHVAFPIVSFFAKETMPTIALPEEFWWAWTSVVGVWAIGRSFERVGAQNKITALITGRK